MGQDHAYVVPAAAQDGMKRVTKRALESAARETTIRFHVSDHWLDRAASAQVALKRRGHPASRAGDVDGGGFNIVTTIAAIHECPFWACVRQDFHLLQRLAQRVPRRGRKRSSWSWPRDLGFIARSKIAGFWPKTYQILQLKDTKNTTSYNKTNALSLVQTGLISRAMGWQAADI